MRSVWVALIVGSTALPSFGDIPEVITVKAAKSGEHWNFSVTIRHADEGWDHYANGWGVYTVDGIELGYRVLAHPHVNEQPFTRSLPGIEIPADTQQIIVRPHDLIHGDGLDYVVDLKE